MRGPRWPRGTGCCSPAWAGGRQADAEVSEVPGVVAKEAVGAMITSPAPLHPLVLVLVLTVAVAVALALAVAVAVGERA